MGKNSICTNLNKEDIIAEIRLTLAADYEHTKSIVVVEGADDVNFFNGKLHEDVDLRESFSGKCGVEEIITYFSDHRVIGICDMDYDIQNTNPQMFYYDYSCLEMMLISNDSAFQSFLYTYYFGRQCPQEIRYQLLSSLKWLSLYRKLSREHNWAVRFDGLSIAKAFNSNTHTLNIETLLSQIIKTNPDLVSQNRSQLELVSSAYREDHDLKKLLLITQGHDFLYCFKAFCESSQQRMTKSPGVLELFHALLCSYRKEDFSESSLYEALIGYQTTYRLNILPN